VTRKNLKDAVLPRTLAAHLLIAELRAEAASERFAASFVDDYEPRVPNPMDSAQARRAQGVSL
jgi:hypothetical protein